MAYKMVCIDMDGTLLGKGRKVSDESKRVIKKLHDNGIEVVVTTGRIYNNAAYYSHLLGVKSPVIAANGAIVRDKYTNKVIYENPIKPETCIKLVQTLESLNLLFHFYTSNEIYCGNYITKVATKLYMTKQKDFDDLKIHYNVIRNIKKWEELFNRTNGKITKSIAFSLEPKKLRALKVKLDEFDDIIYFGAGTKSLEINNKGASKGKAVKALAEHYGFKREEIVCIGDNENDISMIEYAGLGVAMGNAIDKVKDLADFVTDTNKEDGVAKALKKIFDIY